MASLKDLAKLVGVSPTTVSFALNGRSREMRISEELTERILEAAKQLGYQPNNIAVALRTGQTKIIGLIVEDIANHFFSNLAKTIEDEASRFGYRVVYCSTENMAGKGDELINMLQRQHVDGYLITPDASMEERMTALLKRDIPVVQIDRYLPGLDCPYVMVDNHQGVVSGVEFLLKKKYSRISFVTVDLDMIQMKERKLGFVETMTAHGLFKNKKQLLELPYSSVREDAVERIQAYLEKEKPEAVLFATNYVGILGLRAIKNLQLNVPDDLAVVCFDDNEVFDLCTPAITAIRQPIESMARGAVKILMGEMGVAKKSARKQVKIQTSIVRRDSA